MLEEIALWSEKLKDGLQIAHDFHFEHGGQLPKNIKKIIFVGMGGSGISGRVVKTILDKKSTIPSFIVDGTELPAFVDTETLAVVISYSGNTWETVDILDQLVEKFIPTICLAHGGKVAQIAESKNLPFILLPESMQPRTALGTFLGITLGLFDLMGICEGKTIIARFQKVLTEYMLKFQDDPSYFTPFLDAVDDYEQLHVWGISGDSAAFAYRAATQFNENSKVQAVFSAFPELNHNLLVGFTDCNKPPFVLFFATEFLSRKLQTSVDVVSKLLKEKGVVLYKPPVLGDTWEEQLFHIILWADFASVYFGKNRGVDLAPVILIQELKKRFEQKIKNRGGLHEKRDSSKAE